MQSHKELQPCRTDACIRSHRQRITRHTIFHFEACHLITMRRRSCVIWSTNVRSYILHWEASKIPIFILEHKTTAFVAYSSYLTALILSIVDTDARPGIASSACLRFPAAASSPSITRQTKLTFALIMKSILKASVWLATITHFDLIWEQSDTKRAHPRDPVRLRRNLPTFQWIDKSSPWEGEEENRML